MKKIKHYAYFIPDGPQGITESWKECEKMVRGVVGARFKAFDNRREAEAWLAAGAMYEAKSRPTLLPGIYFDAGTGRGKGVEISVTDERGKNLLRKILPAKQLNRFGKQLLKGDDVTNNYGELLALRYALKIAKKVPAKKIFGDSKLVIDYWSRWHVKRKELSEETVELANEVAKLREAFEAKGGAVERISGEHNPADLGFHS
jgi:viroplasmin and RNaseH domain-containing protein